MTVDIQVWEYDPDYDRTMAYWETYNEDCGGFPDTLPDYRWLLFCEHHEDETLDDLQQAARRLVREVLDRTEVMAPLPPLDLSVIQDELNPTSTITEYIFPLDSERKVEVEFSVNGSPSTSLGLLHLFRTYIEKFVKEETK